MSQTQRYTSRTAGRVERRDAPAPYTPTKPTPVPKKSSSIWDYIKSWSFFGSSKDTASEKPEPIPESSSPTDVPPSLQEIITRHRTASPNSNETREVIVAMQAKATKNLYERGLELQREHEHMIQEMAPPPSTSPSEPAEEEKPVPKVYHMPFYHRPGTKEWFIEAIRNRPGETPNEKVANFLIAKGTNTSPPTGPELNALKEILTCGFPPSKPTRSAPVPAPISTETKRQPTGKEILARIQPRETALPVFIDEWITKPKWDYCLPGDDIWDGKIYSSRPRDIPQDMEYRMLSSGSGYLSKKRPGGFWNTGPPPQPTASTSKRPRLADGGLSASTSVPMSLSLPLKSTGPELFIPHASTPKPPPPPLVTTSGAKPLAESQRNDEPPKKEALLKKSQTYKTMQEIVTEEAAKKAADDKERRMKELKEKAMAALDGGAGRPPIRRDRPILRYPDPQNSGKKPSSMKRQPKKEQVKKVPTVNDILDIHTGRADPSQFDASATASNPAPRSHAMKPYEPTPRKRSPKRSLEEHQQEHGEIETAETSPKKKVKTNGIMLATHVQAPSGSGAAAEDAIVIDDLDEEMNDARAPAPNALVPTPASTQALASSVPPAPSKPRAIPTLPPVNPLAPPYLRAFSPSRPSPLRMVSSVDSPEGSPNPTSFSLTNAKPKPEPEVIDVDAEEDQLAEDDNEKTPTPVSTSIVVAPVPAPVTKPNPSPSTFAQLRPPPMVSWWTVPPKVTQPVSPSSPKTTARNAPADSLSDYSKGLPGPPLCYDVVMGEPEAQTIARTVSQDELPAFEIDLSPMFDPTPWIERKNTAPPVRGAPAPSRQAVATRNWAAAGLEPVGPVTDECNVCALRPKDAATQCSVCEASKADAPATSALVTPAPSKLASTPSAAPAPVKPVAFNWAAAGLKPSTPVAGEWTCTVCDCKTKDTLSKCSVCEAPRPGAAASAPTPAIAPISPPIPALISTPAPVKAAPVGFNWAAAGLKPSTPVAGEWTCTVCNCKTKDMFSKCSVCEAPRPGATTSVPTLAPAPTSPPMPPLIPAPAPVKAAPVGFNWAAAGLKLPTKTAGTWTCSICTIDNKPETDKCIACDALRPGSVPISASLTNGFKLPPPIRNNGFTWGIPPSSIIASEPAINGN